MAHYVSDITRFIQSVRESHPELEDDQRKARQRWWDTNPDAEEWKAYAQARVRRGSYVFYPD